MRRNVAAIAAIMCLSALTLPASAAGDTYKIDPYHSSVNFSVRHLVSRVQGRFGKFSGTIVLDEKNPTTAKVTAEIDAASVDTGVQKRDDDLRSAAFFDVQQYPKITFESTGVAVQSPNKVILKGNLTMHGVTKPVTMEVESLGFGPGMRGAQLAGFEAKVTLNRTDFGVGQKTLMDSGSVIIGDDVLIDILIESDKVVEAPALAPVAKPSTDGK